MKQHSLQMKMAYRLGAAALALSLGFTSYAVPDQSDVDNIQNEIDKTQDEIDKTQSEIAALLGVSQVQVSRLERRGLERLRQSFAE